METTSLLSGVAIGVIIVLFWVKVYLRSQIKLSEYQLVEDRLQDLAKELEYYKTDNHVLESKLEREFENRKNVQDQAKNHSNELAVLKTRLELNTQLLTDKEERMDILEENLERERENKRELEMMLERERMLRHTLGQLSESFKGPERGKKNYNVGKEDFAGHKVKDLDHLYSEAHKLLTLEPVTPAIRSKQASIRRKVRRMVSRNDELSSGMM